MPGRQKQKPTKRKPSGQGRVGRVMFAVLVSAAVLALVLFLVLRTQNQTSIAENAMGSVLSPVQNAFSSATIYVRDAVNGVKDYFKMSSDLEDSKQEITALKLQLTEYQEAAIENERLKTLLDAKDRLEAQDPVYARVIARNPGVWFDTFSINKGVADGISVDMAVVTGEGLVGRIYEVGQFYAKVIAVIDPQSKVACLVERTRDNGIMQGQISANGDTPECRMVYLPTVNDVAPGDTVITSGLDNYFPKGITVGKVTEVSRQQTDISDRYALVMPAVDFLHVEEVLVLRVMVETDTETVLPALITPTPRPTPVATPTPTPAPTSSVASGVDEPWQYPVTDETGEIVETPTRAPNVDEGGLLPEEEWAQ